MTLEPQVDRNFAEKLVWEVRKRTMLYDSSHPHYKDRVKVDLQWGEIAAVLDAPVDYIRKRWQNLRGSYSRSLSSKIGASTGTGDSASKKAVRFYLEKQMEFLKSHMIHAPIIMNNDYLFENSPGAMEPSFSQCKQETAEQEYYDMRNNSGKGESTGQESDSDGDPLRDQNHYDNFEPPVTFAAQQPQPPPQKRKLSFGDSISRDEELINLIEKKISQSQPSDPDLDFFKGHLSHVKQLSKRNKRYLFQEFSNNLFNLLHKQDSEQDVSHSQYSSNLCNMTS